MRILLWHGYLFSGTGSNVYTRSLAHAWSRNGHDVTVFSQEPDPEAFDIADACPVRPDIDGLLPVFVLDRYEGLDARLLQDFTQAERDHYVRCNVAALREHLPADLVFANHVLMGAPVGAASGACFAVKAHGSELEYSIRGRAQLARAARAALAGAAATYVGSTHVKAALADICGPVERVYEAPPGVDTDEWKPSSRAEALAALVTQARRYELDNHARAEPVPDAGLADRLDSFLASDQPTVVYCGRLSRNKGVHLLMQALSDLDVRAVVVGSGEDRAQLEDLAPPRTLFTGPLQHQHLVHLLALADVSVVPSIFPEAFGMVAAEAAAAATPPLVAHHSGLAEVAAQLSAAYPPELAHLSSFESGNAADLRAKLDELLALPRAVRRELGLAARRVAVERWSWPTVAERLLAPFRAGSIR